MLKWFAVDMTLGSFHTFFWNVSQEQAATPIDSKRFGGGNEEEIFSTWED